MQLKSGALAVAASFAVYLIPLVGPHTFAFLGEVLFHGMDRSQRSWVVADIAAALIMQAVAFAVFYLYFQKRNLPSLVLLGLSILTFLVVSQFIFTVWIPSLFLIEKDTALDIGEWPPICSASDAWISSAPMPYRAAGESIPEVLIQNSKGGYAIMSIPGCTVTPLALPQPTLQSDGRVDLMLGIDYAVPGAAVLFNKMDTRTSAQAWIVAKPATGELIPVETPQRIVKILSDDGDWISWIELEQIVIRNIRNIAGSKPEVRVDLSPFGTATYVLANIDISNGDIALWRNDELMVLGIDGQVRSRLPIPADVEIQPNTFQRLGDGWVAWDAYRDQDPYRVAWSLPGGAGHHHVPRGRLINSAAVSPSGDLIAISVSTALNIGDIQDAIYVLRAGDGKEVFRRYLPRYTRTQVLFPDKDLFAYSADNKTLLLRVVRPD
jgi:hypothetical protein